MSLEGKVVIVTGSGSGIGRATALLLAREKAKIVLAEISRPTGHQVMAEIEAEGGLASFIQTDVSDESSADAMVAQAVDRFGSVFGLVNNAGVEMEADLVATSTRDWDRILSINLRGVFLCCRSAIPHLRKGGGGSIVNIASVHAQFGFEGCSAYDASKGGVVALTRTAALENGPYQIRVNSISPGYIDTPAWEAWLASRADKEIFERQTEQWHPLRRRGSPLDVARAVRFLLSEDSQWITGINLVVDGGLSVRFYGL